MIGVRVVGGEIGLGLMWIGARERSLGSVLSGLRCCLLTWCGSGGCGAVWVDLVFGPSTAVIGIMVLFPVLLALVGVKIGVGHWDLSGDGAGKDELGVKK